MAAKAPRILDQNLLKGTGVVLSADSYDAGAPTRYLLDQLRSKTWCSVLGWIIIAGFNNKLDFDRGGVKVATIAAGTYTTAADLCAAIVTALEAADAAPLWECTYGSGLFTISADADFTALFGTGANVDTSIHPDIGFDTADQIAAVQAISSDFVAYQSRHWIGVDLGSAQAITAGIVLNDNVSASGTVKLNSSATSILDALTAPDATQTLTDRSGFRAAYFASQSHRYLAFLINDVSNSEGFSEIGIAYAGTYRASSVAFASDPYGEEGEDLSTVELAIEGAQHGDMRAETRAWSLTWHEVPDADAAIFRAFRTATPKGKCFFFDFDSGTSGADIVYGYRPSALQIVQASGAFWTASFAFAEALE